MYKNIKIKSPNKRANQGSTGLQKSGSGPGDGAGHQV